MCKRRDISVCGKSFCPGKARKFFDSKELKEDFAGSSPAPFVGRFGYPDVNVGILVPPEVRDSWVFDAPRHWARSDFQIEDVVGLRSGLVNSHFKANVKKPEGIVSVSQEVGLASRPVDVEVNLEKKPSIKLTTDKYAAPRGASAKLKKVAITSNPKIHTKIEKVFSDTDLKANDAINTLFSKGFDENFLSRMLSVGTVGLKDKRKLVPTRWAITATDDMISKNLLREVKDFSPGECAAYFSSYLGNYYLVLFFSDYWGYELFETMVDRAVNPWSKKNLRYSTDYEGFNSRTDYAEECAGGYYTVRLAILEKLKSMKRQAGVMALRFITDEYTTPLGVWVTREASRKSLASKPITFSDKDLMLTYAKHFAKKKFGIDLENLLKNSRLLKETGRQKRVMEYF